MVKQAAATTTQSNPRKAEEGKLKMARRWIVTAAATLLCSFGRFFVGTEHAAARDNLQWNMCGNACNSGTLQPGAELVGRVDAYSRPDAVTTNEMCSSQAYYLGGQLSSRGYKGAHAGQAKYIGGMCGSIGPGVFWQEGGNVSEFPYANQKGDGETRKMITAVAANPYLVFSTHLHYEGGPVTQNQLREYRDWLHGYDNAGYHTSGAGDLNLNPFAAWGIMGEVGGGAHWREGDQNFNHPTHFSGIKLDYVYHDARLTSSNGNGIVYTPVYSDHMMLFTSYK